MKKVTLAAVVLTLAISTRGISGASSYGTIRDIDGAKVEAYGLTDGQSCIQDLQTKKWGVEGALNEGCQKKFGANASVVPRTAKYCGTYIQPRKAYHGNGPGYECEEAVCCQCKY